MKRFLQLTALVGVFVALCIALPACSNMAPGPAQTVDAALKAITSHDYEALKGYYAGNSDELAQDAGKLGESQGLGSLSTSTNNLTDEQKARLLTDVNKLLEFEYTVGEEKIDGNTATVDVTFTNYDIGTASKSFLQSVLATAFSQALSGNTDSSAVNNAMLSELDKAVGGLSEKNVTKEAQVKLVKGDDGVWKLASLEGDDEYTKQLANAMLGGVVDSLQSWAEQLSSAFGGLGADSASGN